MLWQYGWCNGKPCSTSERPMASWVGDIIVAVAGNCCDAFWRWWWSLWSYSRPQHERRFVFHVWCALASWDYWWIVSSFMIARVVVVPLWLIVPTLQIWEWSCRCSSSWQQWICSRIWTVCAEESKICVWKRYCDISASMLLDVRACGAWSCTRFQRKLHQRSDIYWTVCIFEVQVNIEELLESCCTQVFPWDEDKRDRSWSWRV